MYFQRCHTDVLSFLAEQNKNVRTQNCIALLTLKLTSSVLISLFHRMFSAAHWNSITQFHQIIIH